MGPPRHKGGTDDGEEMVPEGLIVAGAGGAVEEGGGLHGGQGGLHAAAGEGEGG